MSMSLEQFLTAFETLSLEDGDGFSVTELADHLGRSNEWVRNQLRALARQNRIVVSFKTGRSIDGRRTRIPVYKLVED